MSSLRRPAFLLALLAMVLVVTAGPVYAGSKESPAGEPAMARKAQQFLEALKPEKRKKADLPFDSDARTDWTYFPGSRPGVSLGEMSAKAKRAAHHLLDAGLSTKGYTKAMGVVHIEELLGQMEDDPEYKPGMYFVAVFGDPTTEKPWGWRFEGHHLSLNYTSVTDEITATPSFYGANPAIVPSGPYAGMQVMKKEQGLARRLVKALSKEQRKKAIFSEDPPDDILTERDTRAKLKSFKGLPASKMTDTQKELLKKLAHEYTGNLRADLAKALNKELTKHGLERLHFAWAGGTEVHQPHYYRIQAPGIAIEYANTQDNANHIHGVIRDYDGDFGRDLLKAHYKNAPHHQ